MRQRQCMSTYNARWCFEMIFSIRRGELMVLCAGCPPDSSRLALLWQLSIWN